MLSFSALLSLYAPNGIPYRGTMLSGGLIGFYCADIGKKTFNSFGAYTFFLPFLLFQQW